MSSNINTLEDLRAEIKLLKLQKAEQELFFLQTKENIRNTFSSPLSFFRNIKSLLKGSSNNTSADTSQSSDWITGIARLIVPFFLSKTFLKGNGLMAKTLIGLISQKVINGENINKIKVAGWIDKATNWINSTLKKSKKQPVDYGIPPDSETY